MSIKAEYIWLDGVEPTPDLRSKTKILAEGEEPPVWGFDGSSTEQAEGHSSDCVLKPVFTCPDPLRGGENIFVLCEVYNADGSPRGDLLTLFEGEVDSFGLTATADGFYLSWVDDTGTADDELFGQLFDAAGTAVGETIEINPDLNEDEPAGSVLLSDGNIGQVFVSEDRLTYERTLWVQVVDGATGAVVGAGEAGSGASVGGGLSLVGRAVGAPPISASRALLRRSRRDMSVWV